MVTKSWNGTGQTRFSKMFDETELEAMVGGRLTTSTTRSTLQPLVEITRSTRIRMDWKHRKSSPTKNDQHHTHIQCVKIENEPVDQNQNTVGVRCWERWRPCHSDPEISLCRAGWFLGSHPSAPGIQLHLFSLMTSGFAWRMAEIVCTWGVESKQKNAVFSSVPRSVKSGSASEIWSCYWKKRQVDQCWEWFKQKGNFTQKFDV